MKAMTDQEILVKAKKRMAHEQEYTRQYSATIKAKISRFDKAVEDGREKPLTDAEIEAQMPKSRT